MFCAVNTAATPPPPDPFEPFKVRFYDNIDVHVFCSATLLCLTAVAISIVTYLLTFSLSLVHSLTVLDG
jgi:hypothetical protein